MRLLLSVAVVYRFSHAENKSIFAQRYGPCTPPEGTKHTNVRRAETKYKTNVKDMCYPLVSCGFSTLAPLAEMRYTGNTKTNVKEKRDPLRLAASRQATFPKGTAFVVAGNFTALPKAVPLGKVDANAVSRRKGCIPGEPAALVTFSDTFYLPPHWQKWQKMLASRRF